MSHLPFLKALATERIPINRIKTNPQCILVLSPGKKIKLRIYRYKKQKQKSSENKLLQKMFFFLKGKYSSLHSVQQIKLKCLLTKLGVI